MPGLTSLKTTVLQQCWHQLVKAPCDAWKRSEKCHETLVIGRAPIQRPILLGVLTLVIVSTQLRVRDKVKVLRVYFIDLSKWAYTGVNSVAH